MWWAGSDYVDVYLGAAEGGVAARRDAPSWVAHANVDDLAQALFALAAASSRRRPSARVWLSGALARPFMCGPVQGLRHWHEALALARQVSGAATGLAEECTVTLEDWPAPGAALAVAAASATLTRIGHAARMHGVRLGAIRPWWAAALAHAGKRTSSGTSCLVAVEENDALTVLCGNDARYDTAASYVPGPTGQQADKLLARLALTAGVPPGRVLRLRQARSGEAAGIPFGLVEDAS